MNNYKDYIWNFNDYFIEYRRKENKKHLWKTYVAKCLSIGLKGMPQYLDLLDKLDGVNYNENSKLTIDRLIYKINKANGGNDE